MAQKTIVKNTPNTSSDTKQKNGKIDEPAAGKDKPKTLTTRIIVHYDVGFSNSLSIRGQGANLSWDKGRLLKNLSRDEWAWETEEPFHHIEFKVLVNDHHFEIGPNHVLMPGASLRYTPHF